MKYMNGGRGRHERLSGSARGAGHGRPPTSKMLLKALVIFPNGSKPWGLCPDRLFNGYPSHSFQGSESFQETIKNPGETAGF